MRFGVTSAAVGRREREEEEAADLATHRVSDRRADDRGLDCAGHVEGAPAGTAESGVWNRGERGLGARRVIDGGVARFGGGVRERGERGVVGG